MDINGIVDVPFEYGFPLFTRQENPIDLCSSKSLIISDIWSFWDYVIKKNDFEQSFMASLLEQAKYFYNSAETSPVNSKPLLYYYSFLNFAKVLINLHNRYGKSAQYMHGIKVKNNVTFSDSKITMFISTEAKKYVAAELRRALDKADLEQSPLTINVKALLRNCVGIHRTYCEIYDEPESFVRIEKAKLYRENNLLTYEAELKNSVLDVSALSRTGYSVVNRGNTYYFIESLYVDDRYIENGGVKREAYFELAKKLKEKGLWYLIGNNGYNTYLSFHPDNRYSPEFIIYCVMFYLGSITRYQPYLFDSIFSANERWLMSEFLATQPKQFIYLSTAKILGQVVHKAGVDF